MHGGPGWRWWGWATCSLLLSLPCCTHTPAPCDPSLFPHICSPSSPLRQAVFNMTKGDLSGLDHQLQGGGNNGLPSKVGAAHVCAAGRAACRRCAAMCTRAAAHPPRCPLPCPALLLGWTPNPNSALTSVYTALAPP